MKNIDIKVDDEDQALTLLCSLLDAFDNFVNSMLYGRDTISLANVKSALNSMELRTKLNSKGSENQAEGLFVKGRLENSSNFRGRSSERDSSKGKSRGQSQSKSKKKVKCYYCKKYGHYKSECLKLKNKEEVTSKVPLLWLVLLKKILRVQTLSLQFPFMMIVLTISGSLILFVHFICPLKGIGLLPMIQSMVVQS
jgi:hypothetical protein